MNTVHDRTIKPLQLREKLLGNNWMDYMPKITIMVSYDPI